VTTHQLLEQPLACLSAEQETTRQGECELPTS
jgi:hypothetical protein